MRDGMGSLSETRSLCQAHGHVLVPHMGAIFSWTAPVYRTVPDISDVLADFAAINVHPGHGAQEI